MEYTDRLIEQTDESIDAPTTSTQVVSVVNFDPQGEMPDDSNGPSTSSATVAPIENLPPNVTIQSGPKVRKWTAHPGSNRFGCEGRLVCSRKHGTFAVSFCAMTSTIILFHIFDAPFLWTISPAIPIGAFLLSVFTLTNFFFTSFMDPGIIPRVGNLEMIELDKQAWESRVNAAVDFEEFGIRPKTKDVVVNGVAMRLKYCTTCRFYRPPRAVHCSICNNCVLMFDHHCPWVGNCIGLRNYSYFYQFVISLSLLCIYFFASSVVHICILLQTAPLGDAVRKNPVTVAVAAMSVFSLLSLMGLAAFHSYLVVTNQTTNEDIKGTFSRRNRGSERVERNPFTRGFLRNIIMRLCKSRPPSVLDANGYINDNVFVIVPRRVESSS